jgi:hypothetical protein
VIEIILVTISGTLCETGCIKNTANVSDVAGWIAEVKIAFDVIQNTIRRSELSTPPLIAERLLRID